jgi:hypothetical protein
MPVREAPPQPAPPSKVAPPRPYPAEKARGGEIILNTPQRRFVFIAGLAGAVVLAVLMTLFFVL